MRRPARRSQRTRKHRGPYQHDEQGRPIPEPVNDTDARLAYVAVTRARHQLDLGGLSWINTYSTD
ncbi:hypothetical protein OIE49_36160 [Streptomyces sp. NBC_01788]|uniref:hypothetical protein n=1 Tax=Streptomyces sp. NBC_01788 TaxID=2975940 RepID=UPI002DD8CE0D|nr:hypothetical protein [Streptomyces sp. NBC_01788]WSB31429.1 hypothetical protein OIE49_36160 [Streptomyces sp. NBC_01788]